MANNHVAGVPLQLESVLAGLRELEAVFGTGSEPILGAVRDGIAAAVAARDRGDTVGAFAKIGEAMNRLARLADEMGGGEGELMRAAAANFRAALTRGDVARAQETAAGMFVRSGAVEKRRS